MLTKDILDKIHALIESYDQLPLIEGLSNWSEQEIRSLLDTLKLLPADLLRRQRDTIAKEKAPPQKHEPFQSHIFQHTYKEGKEGRRAIAMSKVACVIMAGGQGSRLGWSGPKALFPIFPEQGKTLLQIHLERIRDTYSGSPVAIMCSPLNHAKIDAAMQQARNYGLAKDQVDLFTQDLLPLLNFEKNWFLESPGKLCQGPDGNGRLFYYLARNGILDRWRKKGIEHIVVVPIDNPLAKALDPALIDYHIRNQCDLTTAAVLREDPDEQVGVFAMSNGKPCVAEYSEIDPSEQKACKADGSLLWDLANINVFVFRAHFAQELASQEFPWHVAHKKARCYHPLKKKTEEVEAFKLETFLFDALPMTRKMAALIYPRAKMFAPLKNATGDKSPETVRAALLAEANSR